MVGDMSSILRELEEVQDRLSNLTRDAYEELYTLLTRQEELRTQAARLADDINADCSTQELLIQLASLRRRRDLLDRQHGTATRGLHRPPHGPRRSSQVDQRIERICLLLADRGIRVH
jgi:hypothetical protein